MIGVGSDLPDAVDLHVPQEQVRTRVPRSAGLERRELERETRGERVGLDLGIDA